MNRIKYSFSIILICFAFVLPAVNARSFSETEDALNFTKSLETNGTTMRSNEFSYDCYIHMGDCAACLMTYQCRYCAVSGRCTTDPYNKCNSEEIYVTSCPSGNLTAIYIGVTVACLVLLICKGILLYCIIKRRRSVRNGRIIGQRNPLFGMPGGSIIQGAQGNQEHSRPAAVHSTFKNNADHSELSKF